MAEETQDERARVECPLREATQESHKARDMSTELCLSDK